MSISSSSGICAQTQLLTQKTDQHPPKSPLKRGVRSENSPLAPKTPKPRIFGSQLFKFINLKSVFFFAMDLHLNIQESSIRKKRGQSFFQDNKLREINVESIEDSKQLKVSKFNPKERPGRSYEPVPHSKSMLSGAAHDNQPGTSTTKGLTTADTATEPKSTMPKGLLKVPTEKEIVSAMVRMNTMGLHVPCTIEDLKKLPVIPNTGQRVLKKRGLDNEEISKFESIGEAEELEFQEDNLNYSRRKSHEVYQPAILHHTVDNLNDSISQEEDDKVSVFDLVHRGRQRDKELKHIRRTQVQSPKIISQTPMSVDYKQKFLGQSNSRHFFPSNTSSHSQLIKPTNMNYRTGISKKEQKEAIKNFYNEIQSAVLPEIGSAMVKPPFATRKMSMEKKQSKKRREKQTQSESRKKIQYIHEEFFDERSNGKWTIFNKHAIDVDENPSEHNEFLLEDSIIDQMKMNEKLQPNSNVTNIPESTWLQLHEAKCNDLGIPHKSDKQQERFVMQMLMNQRVDRVCLKDQGLSTFAAHVIGNKILSHNEELLRIDLSNNQLQTNFKALVHGIRNNSRLISLTMRNNQINGQDHADDLKAIVKNHPTLSILDFSNTELNINKNKLKNVGAAALVEGILETEDYSVISEINLSYNYLTSDSLYYFARLDDPDFIQLQQLNLSYNDLGPESIKILGPILGTIVELKLAHTKLGNRAMQDFGQLFTKQEMKLQVFDIHSNHVTTDGFCFLMDCLKANNKVRALNISYNSIGTDIKAFKQVIKFLSCNKILEILNISNCNLKPKAAEMIGKGLRGNRNLQALYMKGNEVKEGVCEISKAFVENKKALCIKELDLSKCQIENEHITEDMFTMIKSEFCTLKELNLKDNFIKQSSGEGIKEALKVNRNITKLCLDFNPIKHSIMKQIAAYCRRNLQLDTINQKNKNLYQLALRKQRARTQKESLKAEIKDLKGLTDKTINEANEILSEVERKQCMRKSSTNFFVTVVPNYHNDSQSIGMSAAVPEPKTSLTKGTKFTFASSAVQHSRHKSQGPMRSEKVYQMTNVLNQKAEQLKGEKKFIRERYQNKDLYNDSLKKEILNRYELLKKERADTDLVLEQKEQELIDLDVKREEMIKNYEEMMQTMKERIQVIKMGQEELQVQIKDKRVELKKERQKYDRFMQRDRERLGYMNSMNNTKRLVQLSYVNEVNRQHAKIRNQENEEMERNRELELIYEEEQREIAKMKKNAGQNAKKTLRKSQTRVKGYDDVRPRLFMSIQSSRQKEQKKFINFEIQKRMEYKVKSNHSRRDNLGRSGTENLKSSNSEQRSSYNKTYTDQSQIKKPSEREVVTASDLRSGDGNPLSENKNLTNFTSHGNRKTVISKQGKHSELRNPDERQVEFQARGDSENLNGSQYM